MSTRGRRIAIVGHLGRAQVRREAARLRTQLARKGAVVRFERELAGALGESGESLSVLARWCQVMISLGGDGTVLLAGRSLAGHKGVLLAVNMGGLGFWRRRKRASWTRRERIAQRTLGRGHAHRRRIASEARTRRTVATRGLRTERRRHPQRRELHRHPPACGRTRT
jgi:NAD kinase